MSNLPNRACVQLRNYHVSANNGAMEMHALNFLGKFLIRLMRTESAAISPMFALFLIPLAGSIAYAVELGGMYYFQRSMQNAADSAAIAAASNNNQTGLGTLPEMEARGAARKFGFVNGAGDQTVTAALTTCPAGVDAGGICYEAVVSDTFPLSFSRLVGFLGSDGSGSQRITSRAVAIANGTLGGGGAETLCAWTLSTDPASFTSNGGPRPDLTGCSLLSNGGMTCNGHDLGADYGVASGTSSGCGESQISGVDEKEDPFAARASSIPANTCPASPPKLVKISGNWTIPVASRSTNHISGDKNWTGNQFFCGDVQLSGDVTLTGSNAVVVINNGRLDLNGHTFKTAAGSTATIIFTGNDDAGYSHYPSSLNGGGTLNITAPTSGTWDSMAIYSNPNVSANVDFTYAGNDPAWEVKGIAYFPNSDIQFSGVVNKDAGGTNCFVLVAYTLLVNGTAQMLANTGCDASGYDDIPTVVLGSERVKLVL